MAERIEPPDPPDDSTEPPAGDTEGQDGASVPGVPFAYDLTRDEIIRQEASIREVNSRLAFLLAAALTFATFFFKEVHDPLLQVSGNIGLIAVLFLLFRGYYPRTYLRSPNPSAIIKDSFNRPGRMKENALNAMEQAYIYNKQVIEIKNWYFSTALRLGVSLVIVGLAAGAGNGIIALWRQSYQSATPISAKEHSKKLPRPVHPEMGPQPMPHLTPRKD